jgi:hypothetical protein
MSDNPIIRIEDKESLQKSIADRYTYPLDIGSQGESKFTIFNIYQYNKKAVNQVELKTALGSIILPIPPELNNTDSLNYEEFSAPVLGSLQEVASTDTIKSQIMAMGGAIATVGAAFVGKLPGGDNFLNQTSALAGASINPKNTNIFRSPSAREHRYTFKMIAKSEAESIAIRKIINKFRYHSYPEASVGQEIIYLSPDLFSISFKVGKAEYNDKDTFLFHPLPSALVAMSVSYNGSSSPVFFQGTNAPVEVTLQLVFKEMELDNKTKLRSRYNA